MRALHWIVALGVLATWPLGMMIKFTAEPFKLTFYMLHESIGFLVLWVMLVRIGIRLTSETPVSSGGGPLAALARLVHALLYLMLVVMPVSGFLATNAHGFPSPGSAFSPYGVRSANFQHWPDIFYHPHLERMDPSCPFCVTYRWRAVSPSHQERRNAA